MKKRTKPPPPEGWERVSSEDVQAGLKKLGVTIARQVRKLAAEQGLNRGELAAVTGARPNTIGKLFSDNRAATVQLSVLQSAILALKTDWKTLLSGEDHEAEAAATRTPSKLEALLVNIAHAIEADDKRRAEESRRQALSSGHDSSDDDPHHRTSRRRPAG